MNSRDLLARMLQAEAGNQGRLGMLAVGSVIDNRRNSPGYGGSGWNDVMLAPGQFSPANSITGYAGGEQGVDLYKTRPSSTAWEVADLILSGQYEDPTRGALNFVNPDISQPSWLKTMGNTTKIGDHLFGSAGTGEGASGRPGGRRPNQDVADDAMRAMGKTPMSQPQAGGLLGDQLGTDMAEYEPERAGGLLGRVFPNMSADRRDQIKMGLAGMSLNPNRSLIGGIEARMGERSKDRDEFKAQQKVQAQKNKTIAFIEAQVQAGKLPQELLQMARVDPSSAYNAAVNLMTKPPKAPTPYSDQARIASDLKNGLITEEQAARALAGDGGPEYGLTPQYVTGPGGELGMIQLSKDGTAKAVEMPEGVALQKGVEKLDLGTHFQWYNTITGEKIGDPIPKNNRAAASETAAGTAEGKNEVANRAAAPGDIAAAQQGIALIDSIINDPALSSITGMFQGRLPPMSQDGTDVNIKVEQLQGQAFLQAFEALRGGGSITEREGQAAQNAMARLNRAQSTNAYLEALNELKGIMETGLQRARGAQGGAPTAPAAASDDDLLRKYGG